MSDGKRGTGSEPLEGRLAPAYDEERVAQTWQRIAEARDRRPYERRRIHLLALPILAAGAAATAIVLATRAPAPPAAPAPLARAPLASIDRATSVAPGADLTAGSQARTEVALDDGSQVVLDPGAQLQVLSNDGERFQALHVRGTIAYDVQAGGARRWEIETAFATIEAIKPIEARVVIARSAHTVAILVERGVVMVRGERVAGRVQRLTTGQRLVVGDGAATADDAATAPAPAPAAAAATAVVAATPAPVTPPAPPTPPVTPPAAPPAPVAPAPPTPIAAAIDGADDLRPKDPEAAAALLERAVASHPDDPGVGLAAFALGRLYLESLGQPGRAAEVFRRIVDRGTPRALLEDAHTRLVEALLASGERHRAREAFDEYARKYPDGRRTAALRARVGAP
jgi:ferric-dicitrate binding protein FerR (iron transport regulator)